MVLLLIIIGWGKGDKKFKSVNKGATAMQETMCTTDNLTKWCYPIPHLYVCGCGEAVEDCRCLCTKSTCVCLCIQDVHVCIQDVHLYPWEYLYVWFQDVYLYPWEYLCDSKMYIWINPCVHLCAFLRYTCVCVQVYPNLCVWVYQRCVCVLVCLFIRNFFFLVHWADFLSDLSDQMLSVFFVHLFLASYVFLKIVCIFFKIYIFFANIINVMKGNRRQLSKLTWRHFLFVNFISVNKNMCMIWWFCIWYHVHVATWVRLSERSVFNNFAQVRNVAYGPFVSSPTY